MFFWGWFYTVECWTFFFFAMLVMFCEIFSRIARYYCHVNNFQRKISMCVYIIIIIT